MILYKLLLCIVFTVRLFLIVLLPFTSPYCPPTNIHTFITSI